jgi:ectoine hydroxylase-related dioxygenase (phytanoyl-CoA dioxygenase family)
MLVNKGRMFRDLIISPIITQVMTHLLGPDFLLSSLTANIARPGGAAMMLHSDQGYFGWTPTPMVANMAWMLDDFTDANGGTRVIPGSHLRPRQPEDTAENTLAAEGKAGSALVFDGRLIHGTGANRTLDVERHALLSYCCRPYVRQQENFFLGLAPELARTEREAFLARLGYRMYAGLGRTEKPRQLGLVGPVQHPVPAFGAEGGDAAAALRGRSPRSGRGPVYFAPMRRRLSYDSPRIRESAATALSLARITRWRMPASAAAPSRCSIASAILW